MNDVNKSSDKPFEFPMMPIFGVDLGERLGSMDARLTRVETDVMEIKRDIKTLDDRVDKCLVAVNRMDERLTAVDGRLAAAERHLSGRLDSVERHLSGRLNSMRAMIIGLYVAVAAGFILQYFK